MELYATELMGSKAYDSEGNFVGRVREFFIEPAEAPNRVSHYLLSRGNYQPLIAKHTQIAFGDRREAQPKRRRTRAGAVPAERVLAGGAEGPLTSRLLIPAGGKSSVNDVDLAQLKANGNVELRLTQVDGHTRRGGATAARVVPSVVCENCRANCRSARSDGNL
jgi:hypothetical protein